MQDFTRRAVVKGGTALGAATTLTGPALLEWAKAWAQAAPWKPEKLILTLAFWTVRTSAPTRQSKAAVAFPHPVPLTSDW